MRKHTPGPWVAADEVDAVGDVQISHGETVVGVAWPMVEVNDSAQRHNARLIAAAPELYEWLQYALDVAEQPHRECDVDSDTKCRAAQYGDGNADEHTSLRAMRRVLAKAEGKE